MRWIFAALGLVGGVVGTSYAAVAASKKMSLDSPHATVRLVSSASRLKAGEAFQLGLYFEIEPEWHIYWKNPGDSGTPLTATWQTSPGVKLDGQRWPVPKRLPVGPLANYGYEGKVLLPFDFSWTSAAVDSKLQVSVKADWLICKVECLPAEGEFSMEIPVDTAAAVSEISADKHLFDKVLYPASTPFEAGVVESPSDYEIHFVAPEGMASTQVKWDFFALEELRIQHAAIPELVSSEKEIILRIPKDVNAPVSVRSLAGLLVAQGRDPGDRVGFEVVARRSEVVPATSAQPLALLLFFAFLGGLILNVMPCVFPVLSIKILSFVNEAQNQKALRRHGWAFALGVMLSFWLLASLLLVLRGSGHSLGWGFQLQSPLFVASLVLLFFLIGLNFLGFFEIDFAGGKLSAMGGGQKGYTSSFLSGVLATVVATPCTAPFMGAALGAALALPALTSLLIFTALGAGMASPYVLLSYQPRWLEKLPRPGAWMETFRQFLAFPIFATALWLLWVFVQQAPQQLVSLLSLALLFLFWIWLRRVLVPKSRKKIWLYSLCVAASAWLVHDVNEGVQREQAAIKKSSFAEFWKPYSKSAFEEALATTPYVFVDFTASWCITCQVNKKLVLNTEATKSLFESHGVAAMRADWTHQDPAITAHLEALGRSSVPTYALFARDRKTFALLPEILTAQILESKIQEFSKNHPQPQQEESP